MRTKTVLRHYCDHCSKGAFRRPDMVKHEAICFRNPERSECLVCEGNHGSAMKPPALAAAYEEGGMKKLDEAAGHCPACTLAGITWFHRANPEEWDETGPWSSKREHFDYKAALADWNAAPERHHPEPAYY